MLPNFSLTERYGTADPQRNREIVESVSKEAALGALTRILGALGVGHAIAKSEEETRAEAEEMNSRFQQLEAAYVGQATRPLHYTRPPAIIPANMSQYYPVGFDQGMVRIASAIGSDLAEMEKEAFGQGFAAMAKGFGGAISGAGKAFGIASKNKVMQVGGALNRAGGAVKAAPGNAINKANNWMANQGAKMQNWGNNMVSKAEQVGTKKPTPTLAASPSTQAFQQPQVPSAPVTNSVNGAAPKGMLERSGLFNAQGQLRTGKLLAGGALLGAGYLGYKGLKAGLNYMTGHSPPASYNLGGNQVPMGVNEYGQPQFGLPG